MRLLVLHRSGYKMLIDGGETVNTNDKPGPTQRGPAAGPQRLRTTASSSNQTRAIQAMNKYRDKIGVRPSWAVTKPSPPPPNSKFTTMH